MNSPKEIGEYLKELRKLKGLTQVQICDLIGVKPGTYAQFETGRTNMTLATLNRIADALGYELQISFNLKMPNKWYLLGYNKKYLWYLLGYNKK